GGTAVSAAAVGGTGTANGNDGTNTTWNTTSLIAVGGKKGTGTSSGTPTISGGAGGTGGTGAAANNDGGRGGQITATITVSRDATGGGGAGGPNGVGGNGGDISANTNTATDGGQGDA